MHARFVTLALVLNGGGLVAVGQTAALRPEWTLRSAAERIDWVQRLDDRRGDLLMAADVAGRVRLFSAATGRATGDWIASERGVRFVGSAGRVGFVRGVRSVYAISATGDDGFQLAWKVTVSNPPGTRTDDDPEYLLRIVAAGATQRGVLIVRSDGVVVELASADGTARWRTQLDPLRSGTLHVLRDMATLVWSAAGVARAAFFDLSSEQPTPRVVELGSSLPIRSGLARMAAQREPGPPGARHNFSESALVAIWVDRLRVVPFAQGDEPCGLHLDAPVSAAALGIQHSEDAKDADVLYAASPGKVSAFDLRKCRASGAPLLRAAEPPVSLDLAGGYVIIRAREAAEFFRAGSRDRMTRVAGPGSSVSASVIAGTAYLLASKDSPPARDEGRCMLLARSLAPDARGLAAFSLSESRSPRQVLWLATRVVTVDADAARSYTLPRAAAPRSSDARARRPHSP